VHEIGVKEQQVERGEEGGGEEEGEANEVPSLIRQFKMMKWWQGGGKGVGNEVQEIMIQRDYTKEMFCIGF